jgi:hypothetical protein
MTTTADSLRYAADLLDGLPGLPPVLVVTHQSAIYLHFKDGTDVRARITGLDAVAAVVGASPIEDASLGHRFAHANVGEHSVTVMASLDDAPAVTP